jgi:hypothetical protein
MVTQQISISWECNNNSHKNNNDSQTYTLGTFSGFSMMLMSFPCMILAVRSHVRVCVCVCVCTDHLCPWVRETQVCSHTAWQSPWGPRFLAQAPLPYSKLLFSKAFADSHLLRGCQVPRKPLEPSPLLIWSLRVETMLFLFLVRETWVRIWRMQNKPESQPYLGLAAR